MTIATRKGRMVIKVRLGDTWQELEIDVSADDTVAAVKQRALAEQKRPASSSPQYEVKFGGALVRDEAVSLGALGVTDGSSLIILARRRRPVR